MGQTNGTEPGKGNMNNIFSPKEINKLYKRFSKLDKEKKGEINIEEFYDIPALAQNPLVQRVMRTFDKNKDGKLSFLEFINGLAVLSTGASEEDKLRFSFKIYDNDDDGYISSNDLYTVLKMMVGNNLTDNQLQQLVDRTIMKADEDKDGKISFEEFKKMVKNLDIVTKLTLTYE